MILDLAHLCWNLRAVGDVVHAPAEVRDKGFSARLPGCVHVALIEAGIIGDPRVGQNEVGMQWVGETDWEYVATLDLDGNVHAHEHIELCFDGLDTIVTLFVNGTEAGKAANMFHEHRFDIKPFLRVGENEVRLRFTSPLRYIREMEADLGARPVNGDWAPYIFMRKAACNFGWDWGPKVATCGVWRKVSLQAWNRVRLDGVRVLVRRETEAEWVVDVHARVLGEVTRGKGLTLCANLMGGVESAHVCTTTLSAAVSARKAVTSDVVQATLTMTDPALWWPARYGAAALYDLHVYVADASNDAMPVNDCGTWRGKIGFREVSLRTNRTGRGRSFKFRVNGLNLFCLGANCIPATLLPGLKRLSKPSTAEGVPDFDIQPELTRAVWAGFNMVRVWGGGMYESDAFYDFCDHNGLMVWQDFMFACAMYPEEPPFPDLIREEATFQVTRLSSRASVVLWCGGNECVWGYENWGWKERLKEGQTWGAGYYHELLPAIVAKLDPTRSYWPNSPWSGAGVAPNDPLNGDRHTWDVKVDGYAAMPTRFCSEFGHQAPSNMATLLEALTPGDIRVWSPALEHRQRGPGGNKQQYDDVLGEWFAPPRTAQEWHYQAQIFQARAVQAAIESCRIFSPRCMGALVWQLNDVWPGLTWSLIDSSHREKFAYWACGWAARPRMFAIQSRPHGTVLFGANDTDQHWRIEPTVVRLEPACSKYNCVRVYPKPVPRRGVAGVCTFEAYVGPLGDVSCECYAAQVDDEWELLMMVKDRQFHYESPWCAMGLGDPPGGPRAWFTAFNLIRDLIPIGPAAEMLVWEQPVTLLPGTGYAVRTDVSERTLRQELFDADGGLRRDRWMCANWFGAVDHS